MSLRYIMGMEGEEFQWDSSSSWSSGYMWSDVYSFASGYMWSDGLSDTMSKNSWVWQE